MRVRVFGAAIAMQIAIGTSCGATAFEAAATHVTVEGKTLVLPAISGLSCDEMGAVIARLDASGYRGHGILPEQHPDFPVFAYEDRLAIAHYRDCTLRKTRLADPGGAFARGFARP